MATLLSWLLAQTAAGGRHWWTDGVCWLQLTVLLAAPWLLAVQRWRDQAVLKQLHGDEAKGMARLSEEARALLSLQGSVERMEAQISEIAEVYHVTKETARALRLPELFTHALQIAPRLLNLQGLRLIDLSETVPYVLRATRSEDGEMVLAGMLPDGKMTGPTDQLVAPEESIVKQASSAASITGSIAQELHASLPQGPSRFAWAPLWRDQKPIGVLIADDLPSDQLRTFTIIANQLSLQLSRIHLYEQVEALAVTDSLTGLFVRNYFLERAQEELERSKRHELSCTLLMVDLDRFKEKNDLFGHLVGDVVLRDVARLLQRNLREVDFIARFGGEEFILLLVETRAEQAMPIAERLRQLVELQPIRAYDELLTQTISMGVAGFPEHGTTVEALIECADEALYAAKRAGRNRVLLWTKE